MFCVTETKTKAELIPAKKRITTCHHGEPEKATAPKSTAVNTSADLYNFLETGTHPREAAKEPTNTRHSWRWRSKHWIVPSSPGKLSSKAKSGCKRTVLSPWLLLGQQYHAPRAEVTSQKKHSVGYFQTQQIGRRFYFSSLVSSSAIR